MGLIDIQKAIAKLNRSIFTTRDVSAISNTSLAATVQSLRQLERAGLIFKLKRGLWCDAQKDVSSFDVVPHLLPHQPLYVSFTSALHLHGAIEQIPQVITIAILSHSRTIRTSRSTYRLHQICKELFGGYDWYRGEGSFLIATPSKALVDCLYLSGRKGKAFSSFPELDFSVLKIKEMNRWAKLIPQLQIKNRVLKALKAMFV